MAARAERFPGDVIAGDRAIFLDGERFGARFRISRGLLAGRCGTVERRGFFPTVDGVGGLRVWRAAVYFLSAAVVDAGGGAGLCLSLECRAGNFHRDRADDGGTLFVCAGATISASARSAFWRGVLCSKSVCAVEYLHAQWFWGFAGARAEPVGGRAGVTTMQPAEESPGFPAAGDSVLRGSVR